MDTSPDYNEFSLKEVLHLVDAAEDNNCDNIFDNVEYFAECSVYQLEV